MSLCVQKMSCNVVEFNIIYHSSIHSIHSIQFLGKNVLVILQQIWCTCIFNMTKTTPPITTRTK